MSERVEMFHSSLAEVLEMLDWPGVNGEVARNVLDLFQSGVEFHFLPPPCGLDVRPSFPPGEPFKIGGSSKENCVPNRVLILQQTGCQVERDESLSFSADTPWKTRIREALRRV